MELQEQQEQLQQLELDSLFTAIEQSVQQEVPGISISQIFESLLNGTFEFDILTLLTQILQPLYGEMAVQCTFLGQMILLAVLYTLLRQLSENFSGSMHDLCGLMMRAIAILLLLQSAGAVFAYGQEALLRLAELMQLFLPVQLTLMTILGNVQTAGLLEPSLMLIVQLAVWCFHRILLPIITFEFILKLVNSFHDTFKLNRLAAFFRKLTLTGIAFSTMLFLAVLSIQGIGGHILDSVSLRTVKYLAGTAIPVVGGTLSGLVETFMSGALIIKSAVGLIGLLAVIVLTVLPALKILLIYFMYSFTAAVLEPVGDDCITALLEQTAGSFVLLFAIVALTGVFFFFMILIVLAAGGAVLAG